MTMLRTAIHPPRLRRGPGWRPGPLTRAGAAGLVLALGGGLAGCAQQAAASGPPIELATAYVGQPQGSSPTDAYLVIRNNGPADRLVSVSTSAGGTVTLRGPARGGPAVMRDVASISVPAHTLIRLDPNGYHLVISGSRPMKADTEITLTLVFAKAGSFKIDAEVTNPETGGSSYFLN
ncbi:MAG TPA: copper chaperone PCu(A)C [Streptosporangiaceae bacterium]|nr:copper chaperone PCu(A)C [Streptosporangiaceae bacterium]